MERTIDFTLISILIPAYNEEPSIESLISRVLDANVLGIEVEIIVIDDFSKDRTFEIVSKLVCRYPSIKVYKHSKNLGKGAALRTGIKKS